MFSLFIHSRKRASEYVMLLTCRGHNPRTCQFFRCRQEFLPNIRQRCLSNPNISLRLRSATDASQIVQFDLKFIDLLFTSKLAGEILGVR